MTEQSLVLPGPLFLGAVALITFFVAVRLLSSAAEAAVPYHCALPEQCTEGWEGEVLKEPSIESEGSSAVQCYMPASGQLLGLVNPATPDGIDRAIASAHEAQKQWRLSSFATRRKVLKSILKYLLDHQDDIAQVACMDSGKTRVDASFGEILVTAEKLSWTIKHGEAALKAESRSTNLLMCYKSNEVIWQPMGVVAACVSWNYPFHNLLNPMISALFTGNGIIVKGSEQTAWSSTYFVRIFKDALKACGHSPNLVHSIVCWPNVAPYLTSHPDISHVTFIGSRPVAHHVAASCAKSLTPVTVELGGKDASIILDDTGNLKKIGSILMRGVFQSAGQNCIGIERIIALPGVYDRLVDHLTPRVKALRVGNPLEESVDVGACISGAQFTRLETLIVDAVKQGARLMAGGQRYKHPKYPSGHYFTPTLLVDVTPSMAIANEELFSPVGVVMRAESLSDALSIANSTEFGLGASVFGSRSSETDRIVQGIQSGMVSVNDFATYYTVSLPFGGVKGSGYGRFGGKEGLRALCNQKSIVRDRVGWLASTAIPPPLDYPYPDTSKAWNFAKGVVELGFGDGWGRSVRGIGKLISSG